MAQKIDMEGFKEWSKRVDKLLTTNPHMKTALQDVVRRALKDVRSSLSKDASSGLGMKSDPRQAYKAVRYAVYKRIFGGQVNILQKRKAGSPGSYQKPTKGLSRRGGNRWGRSQRTKDLEGYVGSDRGFILRFLNAGADGRQIHSYTGTDGRKHNLRSGSGNRGSIAPRNWFGPRSLQEMEKAAAAIQDLIDDLILEKIVY